MNWDWLNWNLARDIVQSAILYVAIYAILKAARGSRFGQVLTGVGILFGVSIAFTFLFHFAVLARILQLLLVYLALSTVVIFQPEIRRILAAIGSLLFSEGKGSYDRRRVTPETMTDAIFELSRRKMGALIAFERGDQSAEALMTASARVFARTSPSVSTARVTSQSARGLARSRSRTRMPHPPRPMTRAFPRGTEERPAGRFAVFSIILSEPFRG